jgi:hypothetical protein
MYARPMFTRNFRTAVRLLVLAVLADSSQLLGQPPHRVLDIDLRSLSQIEAVGPLTDAGGQILTFLDQRHIAIAMTFPSAPPIDQGATQEPFRKLLVLVLNAQTGKVESSRSWLDLSGGAYRDTHLAHIDSGEMLLLIEGHLLRLSSSLDTRAERTLDPSSLWGLMVSSSGALAVLFQTSVHDKESIQVHWISTQTLADLKLMPGISQPTVLLDDSIVYSPVIRPPYDEESLKDKTPLVLDDKGQSRALCASCPGVAVAAFGEGLVVVGHKPSSSYSIVDRTGAVIFDATHGGQGDGVIRAGTTFSKANRIAFNYGHLRVSPPGSGKTPSISAPAYSAENDVIVFDADKRSETVEMALSDTGEKSGNRTSFSPPKLGLSPDGKLLAVFYAGTLQVFEVP